MKGSIKVRNIKEMVGTIERNSTLKLKMQENPIVALENHFEIVPDTRVYRYVIIFLGLTILSTVIGYFVMTILSPQELEPAIIALASGAVGALAGMIGRNQN